MGKTLKDVFEDLMMSSTFNQASNFVGTNMPPKKRGGKRRFIVRRKIVELPGPVYEEEKQGK